jgi:hypothetical protein
MNGKYSKTGQVNNYPAYTMNSPTGGSNSPKDNSSLTITYSGTTWQLKQGDLLIATNPADGTTLPTSGWINNINVSESITATADIADTKEFTVGETISGGSTLGRATILTSSNGVLTVNNAEAEYVSGELLTGLTSGTVRVVHNMNIK